MVKPWTLKEDVVLADRFPKEGASVGLMRIFGTSRHLIYRRAIFLGLRSNAKPKWTYEQDEIIKTRYPVEGITSELSKAVGRNKASIWHRVKRLKLKRTTVYIHPNYTGVGEVSGDYVGSVRRSAYHRGLVFELIAAIIHDIWLAQGKKCFYSGRPISFKDKTASVDRIDPKLGYTVDNIQIVHVWVNSMKMSRTHEEFLALIHLINSYRGNYAER